ncbi:MAG: helix-turn-helix domain-containing protein [Prevotella sp.]|jgi:AraC-like DNA-binding protein|nr:helix-turn-helix domain-containing protein [Prevotella sp.]MCH4019202.1 helix-turn-helix domain-containing protein [Prevotella sp.]MCH4099210.1 helix-turn-helix domain-containing protein [Prevotella sp.]MCI1291665.1 helix-turn-helix domain-containing protein [Prevotella sp.]MCI1323670.1 helix-turn-helix domain-containing protein [Prevotella sp.]MCI1348880.1 helix-turn-helix domain-containing protein [Prevotella sp.]
MEKYLYNLQEFSHNYGIKTVFGSEVAYIFLNAQSISKAETASYCLNFYSISLIHKGEIQVQINNTRITLHTGQLFYLSPFQFTEILKATPDTEIESVFVTSEYYDQTLNSAHDFTLGLIDIYALYSLNETQEEEFYHTYRTLRHFIAQKHVYKNEIIQDIVHIIQFLLSDLTLHGMTQPHDASHKEEIYRIFVHLAAKNFRKERQLKFYADQLNITSTYLSRTIREVSGHTVYDYLESLLYDDACSLLKTTSKSIGEIAELLSFHDQAAFSNFFKQHSGMSPLAFRK